jgi:hypothetical protein
VHKFKPLCKTQGLCHLFDPDNDGILISLLYLHEALTGDPLYRFVLTDLQKIEKRADARSLMQNNY